MRLTAVVLLILASASLPTGCASKGGTSSSGAHAKSSTGIKVLEGVVSEREHEGPGSGGASFQGTGNYYLIIEAQEGEATAHYRFQVTYQQWFRFPEGSHVTITVNNNFLQDIRSTD
jgi:hypothetical protein